MLYNVFGARFRFVREVGSELGWFKKHIEQGQIRRFIPFLKGPVVDQRALGIFCLKEQRVF